MTKMADPDQKVPVGRNTLIRVVTVLILSASFEPIRCRKVVRFTFQGLQQQFSECPNFYDTTSLWYFVKSVKIIPLIQSCLQGFATT